MNSRFRNLGFGSKRKSSSPNILNAANNQALSPATTNGTVHTPTGSASSTSSLPMNHTQNGLGRPPSYTYNNNAPRATSPMPPGAPQSVSNHPPPINTSVYSQGHPALGGASQPPQYAGGYGGGGGVHGGPQYGGRGAAVEVEGAGRSKAQLIVGIDFVSTNLPTSQLILLTYGKTRALLSLESRSHSLPIQKPKKT